MLSQPNRGWSDNVIERHPRRSGYTSVTYIPYKPVRRKKMPCRTDDPTPNEIRNNYEEEFTHNSKLAEIFCATMLTLEKMDKGVVSDPFILRLPKKAQAWWNDHKERDRKKVAAERKAMEREQAIETALSKLTPEERKLLGVKGKPIC